MSAGAGLGLRSPSIISMKLYPAFSLLLLFAPFPYSSAAQFTVQAGPSLSEIHLYRRSATIGGFDLALAHRWSYLNVEVGFQDAGRTTTNFYGQELIFSDDILPDSRSRVDVKSEYIAADIISPRWHRISAKVGIGVGMVQTRVTSMALNAYSKEPITDYSYNAATPKGRLGLGADLGLGWSLQVLVSISRMRAAPDNVLVSSFGGGELSWISVAPRICYSF